MGSSRWWGRVEYWAKFGTTGSKLCACACGGIDLLSFEEDRIVLRDSSRSEPELTERFANVVDRLRAQELLPPARNELYPVTTSFSATPVALVDRSCAPWFGLRAFGVHVNGIVHNGRGEPESMWLGVRSADRRRYPGCLDQLAAGGQPYGLGVLENAIKELGEEAAVPAELAASARPVGTVSYVQDDERDGLKPDTMFCFDLALPADFRPTNTDGEVDRFELVAIDELPAMLAGDARFKSNCALVVLDYLLRHGRISADTGGYDRLVSGLHRVPTW